MLLCSGPGYRNVVGLPGGVSSPYFKLLQEANVNGMELREGKGNVYEVRAWQHELQRSLDCLGGNWVMAVLSSYLALHWQRYRSTPRMCA